MAISSKLERADEHDEAPTELFVVSAALTLSPSERPACLRSSLRYEQTGARQLTCQCLSLRARRDATQPRSGRRCVSSIDQDARWGPVLIVVSPRLTVASAKIGAGPAGAPDECGPSETASFRPVHLNPLPETTSFAARFTVRALVKAH